jgi:hypothetical protein
MCVLGLLTPTAVRADGIDYFTFHDIGDSDFFTWQLPASPNILPGDADPSGPDFQIEDVLVSIDGVVQSPATFYVEPDGEFMMIGIVDSPPWGSADMYSGTVDAPTFILGTVEYFVYEYGCPHDTCTIA